MLPWNTGISSTIMPSSFTDNYRHLLMRESTEARWPWLRDNLCIKHLKNGRHIALFNCPCYTCNKYKYIAISNN